MFHTKIYSRSSPPIQELLISSRARVRNFLREGRSFRAYLARAEARERWSEDRLREYQKDRLYRLLMHAKKNIPYYASLFRKARISVHATDVEMIISSLPMMSKEDIVRAGASLSARTWRRGKVRGSTSGTTGTPVTILQDFPAINRENAFIARQLAWAGFRRGDPNIWLRGDMIVPADSRPGPYWRRNAADNMLMMSSYHLSEATAGAYIAAMEAFRPKLIEAYPSSISYLARFLRSTGRFYEAPDLQSVVTRSESLSMEDRRLIEETFRCRVFDWYGSFERVAAIGTCEFGKYHLLTDYAFVEFEPASGGLFEVIGTGFNNYLMPLIRYRTGDLVELPDAEQLCACGRAFPIVSRIEGRRDDYIKLPDGRFIGRMDHVFKGLTGIAEAQIVQDKLDELRIRVVPFRGVLIDFEATLVDNVRQRVGSNLNVSVELVEQIPRTSRGKFRAVVCNV